MLISGEYRALNRACHEQNDGWGKGGVSFLDEILDLLPPDFSVLDYGCGKGALVEALRAAGYAADGVDPSFPDRGDVLLSEYDMVVCTDVLEHVEPECLEAVLDNLSELARWEAFVVVGLTPAVKNLPDGTNAHRVIQPAGFWQAALEERFGHVELLRVSHSRAVFWCYRWSRDGDEEGSG